MRLAALRFYVLTDGEKSTLFNEPLKIRTHDYVCGGCGRHTHARVIAESMLTGDTSATEVGFVVWTFCSCGQPTAWRTMQGGPLEQFPRAIEFRAGPNWPAELSKLFQEAILSFTGNAFTACVMVCRKVLMACAVKEGDVDGKSFAAYVDYITNTVLTYPKARGTIDALRTIGNDANHDVSFVDEPNARRAMRIVQYMLDAIYSLPAA